MRISRIIQNKFFFFLAVLVAIVGLQTVARPASPVYAAPSVDCAPNSADIVVVLNSSGGDGDTVRVACADFESGENADATLGSTHDIQVNCMSGSFGTQTTRFQGNSVVDITCSSGVASYYNGSQVIVRGSDENNPFDEEDLNDAVNPNNGEEESDGADCRYTGFFGIPPWYRYLEREPVSDPLTGGESCNVKITSLTDVWFIVAAGIEILLRIAALVAVGFIIYGGVQYIISQSQPDKTAQALKTTINAVIGLAIAIVAAAVVAFIAGSFQ